MTAIRKFLLGPPIPSRMIRHERLTKSQGLAVYGADPLSSTAYATEEIFKALVAGGAWAFFVSLPIALVIAALIFLVSYSYRQAIYAYPSSGGVYVVAKDNLGELWSLVAAAALLIDYALTAGVSIAAGVAGITSAVESLRPYRVELGIFAILVLTIVNLRGVRDSGRAFSIPTQVFIAVFGGMIAYGCIAVALGWFPGPEVMSLLPVPEGPAGLLGIALILKAFSSGCAATTGIEAISNGVQTFEPPESKNAATTMMRMACILSVFFIGITFLAYYGAIIPSEDESETMVSQVARALFGSGPLYLLVQAATVAILFLAANTPFADFPRVASRLAEDGYLPHQFANLGSRGVYTFGIMFLSMSSFLLVVFFGGSVHALIPLYAVGVFQGFSISQLGMVRHWVRLGAWAHKWNIVINALGCSATTLVFFVTMYAKFWQGAYILPPFIVLIVMGMKYTKRHYVETDAALEITNECREKIHAHKTMVIPIGRVNKLAIHAFDVALSHHPAHIYAVHVALDESRIPQFEEKWRREVERGNIDSRIKLEIRFAEYRDISGTLFEYFREVQAHFDNDRLVIAIPILSMKEWWKQIFHNHSAPFINRSILNAADIKADVFEIPMRLARTHA